MPKYKDEYSEVKVGDREMLLPKRLVGMLQMAAYDWPRVEIAKYYELSVRTVEAHFDRVRKACGKRTFAGLLVELKRNNVIQ